MIFRRNRKEQGHPAGAGRGSSCACLLPQALVSCSCLLFLLLIAFASAHAQSSDAPLTNSSVIKLVKAGFKEKTVIAIIHSRPNHFKLDTEQLINLKHNGVGESIILAMLSQDSSLATGDDWEDDQFFRSAGGRSTEGGNSGSEIFGSSGGSKSQSRTRGTQGGNENEGNVTGSATVRILRPPSEAGGAPPKLERTPSLTNEEIIRLVAAGFSEGTIIKRIENSPADYDLSATKVDELHKNRVTDPIIAAMTTAMGGDREGEQVKRTPQP